MVDEVKGEFRGHPYRARRWRAPGASGGVPGYWVVTVEPRREEPSRMIFPAQPDDTPSAVRAEVEAWLQTALG